MTEIWTSNFQLQYLLQLYLKNLTIVLQLFTGNPVNALHC